MLNYYDLFEFFLKYLIAVVMCRIKQFISFLKTKKWGLVGGKILISLVIFDSMFDEDVTSTILETKKLTIFKIFLNCNHRVSFIFCIVILHKTSRHSIIPPYYISLHNGAKFIIEVALEFVRKILMSLVHDVTRDFFFTFSLGQSKRVSKFIVKLWIHKNQMRLQK